MTTTPLLISPKNDNCRIRILTQSLQRKTFISRTASYHASGTDAAIRINSAGGEGSAGGIGHAVACAVYGWFYGEGCISGFNVDERDVKEVVEDDDSTGTELDEIVEEEMVDKVVEVNEGKNMEVEIVPEIKLEEAVVVDDKVENVDGNMNEDTEKLSVLEIRDFDREIVDVLWDKDESGANVVESKFRVTVTCEEDPDDRLPTLDVGLDEKLLGAIIVLDVDASVFALVVADGLDDKLIEVPAD
ncbi:hypothetical protein ACHAO8_009468 [Botrytis cinerea]